MGGQGFGVSLLFVSGGGGQRGEHDIRVIWVVGERSLQYPSPVGRCCIGAKHGPPMEATASGGTNTIGNSLSLIRRRHAQPVNGNLTLAASFQKYVIRDARTLRPLRVLSGEYAAAQVFLGRDRLGNTQRGREAARCNSVRASTKKPSGSVRVLS